MTWEATSPGEPFGKLLDSISLDSTDKTERDNAQVFLLTMHNAKGLEFPSVVVAGINSSYMPFFLRKEKDELEEERRLFYVASTRAIKQLIISSGSERPSRFLTEVRPAFYSTAYSLDDIVDYWAPHDDTFGSGFLNSALTTRNVEEKFLDHPIFGRGKIINAIDEDKYIVEFVTKGQKTIDTSIVPVTFL